MRLISASSERVSGHAGPGLLATPVRRHGWLGKAIQLYRQHATFRDFLDFALIGGLVLLFLHPPALPDLWSMVDPPTEAEAPDTAALAEMLRESRLAAPTIPTPRDLAIDASLFATSTPETRRQLADAVVALESGEPANSLELLNQANADDRNVLLMRALAMLALPGPENHEAAISLLDRAVERGQRQANVYRGLLLVMGQFPFERDGERGLALMRDAADRGDPVAARLVGAGYHLGWGGMVDQGLAAHYLRLAIEGGDPEAHVALAYFTMKGIGVAQDGAEGLRLLTRGAELGNAEGQAVLGAYYFQQFMAGWMPDPAEAVRWLERAAEQGDVNAMHALGMILIELGKEPQWLDYPRAVALFERCAAQWHGPCLFAYAASLERGRGIERDLVQAYGFYAISEQFGQTKAPRRMATLESQMTATQVEHAQAFAEELERRRRLGAPALMGPMLEDAMAEIEVARAAAASIGGVIPDQPPSSEGPGSVAGSTPGDLPELLEGAAVRELQASVVEDSAVRGILIETVHSPSQAAHIGLRSGDVIVGVNQHPIGTLTDLNAALERVGNPWVLQVRRNGEVAMLVIEGPVSR